MKLVNKISFATMMLSLLGICFFGMGLDSPSDMPIRMVIIFLVSLGISLYIYYDSEGRI